MNQVSLSMPVKPWYQQLWPWLLISMPLTAVVAGLATWYIAWKSNDGLVADDYYKRGVEINKVLNSEETARRLGLVANLTQTSAGLRLSIKAEREIVFPERLRLLVVSPVRSGQDRVIELIRENDVYLGSMDTLPPGRWNLLLEDEGSTWRIPAVAVFPLTAETVLKP